MKSSDRPPRKVIPIAAATPDPSAEGEFVSLYEAQKKIYPRSISGYFARWRWAMVFLTQIVFYGLPWLEWGQRQMVLFDLGARRFLYFRLGSVPAGFHLSDGAADHFGAFAVSVYCGCGRLWCGFACPQTVYTEIFMWIEHKIEGDRSARLRLDAGPWTFEKIRKKFLKQAVWVAVSLWTGFTFVGYFVPIRELGA
jgi:polyferredoxin